MPLQIIRHDITTLKCDAIVNAANQTLLGGGGVDGAIHRAAGPELLAECRTLGGCRTGEAKITKGYRLPAKYVIHTVGPIWRGGGQNERALLASCYRNSLALAKEAGCETVAFPLISAGVYGYPKDLAFHDAVDAIAAFLAENDMTVYIVYFGNLPFPRGSRDYDGVSRYLDDLYVDALADFSIQSPPPAAEKARPAPRGAGSQAFKLALRKNEKAVPEMAAGAAAPELTEALNRMDESFQQMLLRKIDEKGMTDTACYKRANIDRKHFSKIRRDIHYRPGKPTAVAFAIALELSLPETRELLMKAGFALSHSSKFDIIIEYYINNGNYNIFEINETLFAFDQQLLG